jgi:hypothetical protein
MSGQRGRSRTRGQGSRRKARKRLCEQLEARLSRELGEHTRNCKLVHAELAAEAALAAHAQGKFRAFHDRLFAHQSELDRAALLRHANAVGLDTASFRAALDQHAYRGAVDADLRRRSGQRARDHRDANDVLKGERMLNAADRESVVAASDELLATGYLRLRTETVSASHLTFVSNLAVIDGLGASKNCL